MSSVLFSLCSLTIPGSVDAAFPSNFDVVFTNFVSQCVVNKFYRYECPEASRDYLTRFVAFFYS